MDSMETSSSGAVPELQYCIPLLGSGDGAVEGAAAWGAWPAALLPPLPALPPHPSRQRDMARAMAVTSPNNLLTFLRFMEKPPFSCKLYLLL